MENKEIKKCKFKFSQPHFKDGAVCCALSEDKCEDIKFICDENCRVYELQQQLQVKQQECKTLIERFNAAQELNSELRTENEKFRKANDEKNEFLLKLGISAGGEFHRIKHYTDKLQKQADEYKRQAKQYLSDYFKVDSKNKKLVEALEKIIDGNKFVQSGYISDGADGLCQINISIAKQALKAIEEIQRAIIMDEPDRILGLCKQALKTQEPCKGQTDKLLSEKQILVEALEKIAKDIAPEVKSCGSPTYFHISKCINIAEQALKGLK
jgi:hypothetical protein